MRKAFFLGPVLLLAALMSGCGSAQLIVVRDIPAGDVIQESDLQPWGLFGSLVSYLRGLSLGLG